MSPIEYADKLRLQLAELQRNNTPLKLGVTSVTALMATRIFIEGKATDGGPIGEYEDTKFRYWNPKKVFSGGTLRKEIGKFKNGKKRKTAKLTYKGYKSALGKPAGGAFVNLELSGDLKSEFTNRSVDRINTNEFAISLGETDKMNVVNWKKAEGNEKRFDKQIFYPTKNELNDKPKGLFYVIEYELRQMFSA